MQWIDFHNGYDLIKPIQSIWVFREIKKSYRNSWSSGFSGLRNYIFKRGSKFLACSERYISTAVEGHFKPLQTTVTINKYTLHRPMTFNTTVIIIQRVVIQYHIYLRGDEVKLYQILLIIYLFDCFFNIQHILGNITYIFHIEWFL